MATPHMMVSRLCLVMAQLVHLPLIRDMFRGGVVYAKGKVPSMRAAMRMRTHLGVTPAGDARSLCGRRTFSPVLDRGMTDNLQGMLPRLPREAI